MITWLGPNDIRRITRREGVILDVAEVVQVCFESAWKSEQQQKKEEEERQRLYFWLNGDSLKP